MAEKEPKITWVDIFLDFKLRHPKYGGRVLHYQPYGYATIFLIIQGVGHMSYNYDTKELVKL